MTGVRIDILKRVSSLIQAIQLPHPTRVGIDGVDCSGKTTLSKELEHVLTGCGREIIAISIDRFHNPKKIRYRQGSKSPKGYYEDTFNNSGIIANVLSPLGPKGDLRYNASLFDFRTDAEAVGEWKTARADSILLFEGVFLHRPELIDYWDFTVFVDVDFEETLRRAKDRDRYLFGTADEVEKRYRERYIPGQQIYLKSVDPLSGANVVIQNADFDNPVLIVRDE